MNCMKYFIPFLVSAISIISCNDGNEGTKIVYTDSSSIEKQIKSEIAARPDSMLLKEKLIKYYEGNGEYDEALAYTNQLLKMDSTNVRLWEAMATLYFDNNDTTAAIFALQKAVGLFPDPQDLLHLGTLYGETKDPKALSIANTLRSVKNGSGEKDSYFIKGLYYNYTHAYTKAIAVVDSCLALDYTYMMAYREKAVAMYELARYEAALTVLDKALAIQNNFDEGYYWRGRCLEKLNRKGEAIEAYQLALANSDQDFVDARQALERLGVVN